jgi:predicted amidohydrolase
MASDSLRVPSAPQKKAAACHATPLLRAHAPDEAAARVRARRSGDQLARGAG